MSPENTKKPIPPTKEPIVTGKIGRRINRRQIILILLGLVVLVGGIFAYRATNQPKPVELSPAEAMEQSKPSGMDEGSQKGYDYRLAFEYHLEGNQQKTLEILDQLDPEAEQPGKLSIYDLYAQTYSAIGDSQNSQRYFVLVAEELQKMLDATEKSLRWGALITVAKAYEDAGQPDKAKQYYQEFLDTVPAGEKKDETIQASVDNAKAALERLN